MSRYLPSNSDYDLQQAKMLLHTRKRIFKILKNHGIERTEKHLNETARLLYGLITNNQEAFSIKEKIIKRIHPPGIPIPIAASKYDIYPQTNLLSSCIYILIPEEIKQKVYSYSDYPPQWISINQDQTRNEISNTVYANLLALLEEKPYFKPSQTRRIESLERRMDELEIILKRLESSHGTGRDDPISQTRRQDSS